MSAINFLREGIETQHQFINNQNMGGRMWVANLLSCFLDGLGLESVSDLGGLLRGGLCRMGLTLATGGLAEVEAVSVSDFLPKSQFSGFCIFNQLIIIYFLMI